MAGQERNPNSVAQYGMFVPEVELEKEQPRTRLLTFVGPHVPNRVLGSQQPQCSEALIEPKAVVFVEHIQVRNEAHKSEVFPAAQLSQS